LNAGKQESSREEPKTEKFERAAALSTRPRIQAAKWMAPAAHNRVTGTDRGANWTVAPKTGGGSFDRVSKKKESMGA
jgi:hypothetical protein